jgi:3-phenylpropionate/trans-cinnamate dioxygenase ferredoxin subunit
MPPMSNEQSITVALRDVAEGKMRSCMVAGREIVVCRTKEGIYAVDNICTHAYARLDEGRLRGTRLICPLHGASFDIRDGRVLGAPATRPLATHSVTLIDDQIEISLSPGVSKQLTL